jgi:ubiquinone/menaquinone biosynthesis C-methylase UbiE
MSERTAHSGHYIPGLGRGFLTPMYDLVHRLFGIGKLHAAVIDAAAPKRGERVLDIGCATGNLLRALSRRGLDQADLAGIDPDPKALRRARRKVRGARIEQGSAAKLPYQDQSVDVVFSTLMFHHLDAETKDAALAEVARVLRPGGRFLLADFDAHAHAHGPFGRSMEKLIHDNTDLTGRLTAAGLAAEQLPPYPTRFGEVQLVRGTR